MCVWAGVCARARVCVRAWLLTFTAPTLCIYML